MQRKRRAAGSPEAVSDSQRAPLRVLFASAPAGGGHNAVRDAIVRAVEAVDPLARTIEPTSWTARHGFDAVHRTAVKLGLSGAVFALARAGGLVTALTVAANPLLLSEVLTVARRERPDVVVSTHFALTYCFVVARWLSAFRGRLVNAIPDYGVPPRGFLPDSAFLRPEGTLVTGEDTELALAGRVRRAGELQRIGALVSEPFRAIGRERARLRLAPAAGATLRDQWHRQLTAQLPEAAALDPGRPTLGVLGGSGFAAGVLPVLTRLLDGEDGGRFNAVVVCGRDEALRRTLQARYRARPGVAILGFLSHPLLALVHGVTDVPLLGSIAHSTLQELLASGTGPLLVFRRLDGTEPAYVEYIERHRLGLYQPDAAAMTALCREALGLATGARWRSLAREFVPQARRIQSRSERRALRIVDQIVSAADL